MEKILGLGYSSKRRRLMVFRLDEAGERTGKNAHWHVQDRSNLPREVFSWTNSFVREGIARGGKATDSALTKRAFRALRDAAEAFGCEAETEVGSAVVVWNLSGGPFVAFQIHCGEINKDRTNELEQTSEAVFRFAL